MKLQFEFPFPQVPKEFSAEFLQAFVTQLSTYFQSFADEINGQIAFGNGTDLENVRGKWITYVSNGVANTEDTVAHGLTVTPIGYLVVKQDKAGSVYSGSTAWDTTNLYLKSNTATLTALLFVLTAPEASS